MNYNYYEFKNSWISLSEEQLIQRLPEGLYNIGDDELPCYTGKNGVIEFILLIQKDLNYIKQK
jgi:hypothetical protein